MTDRATTVERPGERRRTPGRRRLVVTVVAIVAVLVLGVAALGLVFYARGGGPVPDALGFLRPKGPDPLAPSSPAESVLRTLRLAGYRYATVGDENGTVVVRVAVPEVRTPEDVTLTWQTGMAAASAAYPAAQRIVVQVFSGSQGLVEVAALAAAVEAAVKADNPSALRRATSFRYLSESGQ